MADLQFEQVNKIYSSGVHALKGVSFTAYDGEFVVIVGPSGCGKTTILRLIAGLEEVTDGEILLDGNLTDVSVKDRNFAMVFQNYALYPHMTVRQNIALGCDLKKQDKESTQKKVQEIARVLGIEDCLDRRPNQLSGGQKQRTALGRAIASDPRIFLFDEPLSNLDPSLRGQTRRELKALHGKLNKTFIYVTHDKTEAMTMADRLIIMREGKIVQNDAPATVYAQPADTFVAEFMDPDINFMQGECHEKEGTYLVKTDHFEFESTAVSCTGRVTLAMRGVDFCFDEKPCSIKIDGTITAMDNLGDEIKVTVLSKLGKSLLVRANSDFSKMVGESIRIWIDADKILVFDGDGKRI
ncbi:MAG: ABC transporter ATP-binding protein [Clostridia bacterium]|nr:ABC transporter ATP-binding protein [Clostridia bacterium]